jgi:hypothetical protein
MKTGPALSRCLAPVLLFVLLSVALPAQPEPSTKLS